MKRALLAATAAIAVGAAFGFATPASAQDFGGFYAGIHGGYAWGDNKFVFAPGGSGFGSNNLFSPNTAGGTFSQSPSNGVVGGHFGYNYDYDPSWVLGIEMSIDGNGPEHTSTDVFAPTVPSTVTYHSETNWFGSVTPRLGFDTGSGWLFYAKGGLAFGEQQVNLHSTEVFSVCTAVANCVFNQTQDQIGWTVGAGLEWAVDTNASIGVEYNYYDLGTANYGGEVTPNTTWPVQFSQHPTFNAVLFRISYMFGQP